MNSLLELNTYSNTAIDFTDERPYVGTFSNIGNQTVTVAQGGSWIAPYGAEIISLQSAPNIAYAVNIGNTVVNSANIQVVWPTVSGITTTTANGVFTATGVNTLAKWNLIKYPEFTIGNILYQNSFTYTSSLNDYTGNLYTWNTAVTLDSLSTVVRTYTYTEDLKSNLSFSITDSNTSALNSYTVEFTQTSPTMAANPGRFVSNGAYGAYGSNLTLTGTKASINSTTVAYSPPVDYTSPITLNYRATKFVSNVQTNTTGNISLTITNTGVHNEYSASTNLGTVVIREGKSYLNGYQILDQEDVPGQRTYTVQMTIGNSAVVNFIRNDISFTGPNLTISGTKASINSILADTANTYILGNASAGSTTVLFKLTRTSPDTTVLANNVSATISSYAPTVGTNWQGGTYIGIVGTNHLIVISRAAQSSAGAYTYVENYAPDPSGVGFVYPGNLATSTSNGVVNSSNLKESTLNQDGYQNWYRALNASMTQYSGYGGWYMPSTDELYLAVVANATINGGFLSSTISSYPNLVISGWSSSGTGTATAFSYTYYNAWSAGYTTRVAPFRRVTV